MTKEEFKDSIIEYVNVVCLEKYCNSDLNYLRDNAEKLIDYIRDEGEIPSEIFDSFSNDFKGLALCLAISELCPV